TLSDCTGMGSDTTLGPIPGIFPSADQIAFGPGAWSLVTPWPLVVPTKPCTGTVPGPVPVNWNRAKSLSSGTVVADINSDGGNTTLFGSNDWANVLYRFSAAIDFAGGRSETLTTNPNSGAEMTKENETDFFLRKDVDGNGIGDGRDCGGTI